MPERVSNTDIRLRIRLCENSLGRGDPHHMALLDLLDAREKIKSMTGEMEEGWRIANKEGARADIAEQRIKELEVVYLERPLDGADAWEALRRGIIQPREASDRVLRGEEK